jgi:hypothetical protein
VLLIEEIVELGFRRVHKNLRDSSLRHSKGDGKNLRGEDFDIVCYQKLQRGSPQVMGS